MSLPNCPKCSSEYTYEDGDLLICPECSYEWKEGELSQAEEQVVIKDLKIKGSSSVVKVGTKVKSIRLLTDSSDGHDIDCKIEGIGQMKLKSEFVKKV